jgi:hypothetical protein
MPATMSSATGQNAMPAFSLDSFKGQFKITTLMDKISNPVLEPHRQAKAILAKTGLQRPKESLQGSLQVTEQLVEHFDKYAIIRAKGHHLDFSWQTVQTLYTYFKLTLI